MSPDFWTGVVVALVVGIIANLLTPLTRNALLRALAGSGYLMRAMGSHLRAKAASSLERELRLLDELQANPTTPFLAMIGDLAFNQLLLWALVYSFGAAYLFGWHTTANAQTLFFGFLGAASSTFFSLLALLSSLGRFRDIPAHKARTERQLAALRRANAS